MVTNTGLSNENNNNSEYETRISDLETQVQKNTQDIQENISADTLKTTEAVQTGDITVIFDNNAKYEAVKINISQNLQQYNYIIIKVSQAYCTYGGTLEIPEQSVKIAKGGSGIVKGLRCTLTNNSSNNNNIKNAIGQNVENKTSGGLQTGTYTFSWEATGLYVTQGIQNYPTDSLILPNVSALFSATFTIEYY